jgi:hypothetical protein
MEGRDSQSSRAAAAFRQTKYTFLALGILLFSPVGLAGELSVLVNGWAKHVDVPAGTKYNEKNWGTGFQYDYDRVGDHWVPFVTAAGFKDSESNMSYYAGGGLMRRFDIAPKLDNLYVDVGLVGFVMTRKTYKDNDPFLGALPAATIGTDHFSVNVTYVPKVHPKLVPLWFFQFKVPIAKF